MPPPPECDGRRGSPRAPREVHLEGVNEAQVRQQVDLEPVDFWSGRDAFPRIEALADDSRGWIEKEQRPSRRNHQPSSSERWLKACALTERRGPEQLASRGLHRNDPRLPAGKGDVPPPDEPYHASDGCLPEGFATARVDSEEPVFVRRDNEISLRVEYGRCVDVDELTPGRKDAVPEGSTTLEPQGC